MYCPTCHQRLSHHAGKCTQCSTDVGHVAGRLYIGRQFIFVDADETHPVALRVDDAVQTYRGRAILSRHVHAIGFGDLGAQDVGLMAGEYWTRRSDVLPDLSVLALSPLQLTAVVTDRKIYKPGDDATLFIVAPDAGGQTVGVEVQLAGQKVYEAKVPLNAEGLALHRYPDVREGEYTAVVTFGGRPTATAECTFSVAEFTLSPLIATLQDYQVVKRRLTVTLKILLLSQPYTGPAEVRLHCPTCAQLPPTSGLERLEEAAAAFPSRYFDYGGRVSRPVTVEVRDGVATAWFRLCDHNGPFRIEVVTPHGHTAQVALPGLGVTEREKIPINPLGQTVEASLAPWPGSQPVRGLFLGPGEVATTPVALTSAYADRGELRAWADVPLGQLVLCDPRSGERRVTEIRGLKRDDVLTFDVGSPYTLFTVAVFSDVGGAPAPFEGWGIVVKPVACDAILVAPATAAPAAEIEVFIEPEPDPATGHVPGLFCWLLAYDARLEHESPVPKLGKRIYEGIKAATGSMKAHKALRATPYGWELWQELAAVDEHALDWRIVRSMPLPRGVIAKAAPMRFAQSAAGPLETAVAEPEAEAVEMVVSPARMEFPELVHNELFYFEGTAARTIRLGDQIGTWRVRAYLFRGADCRELTADIQAEKPIYAELDLPAIASDGDEITATVQYHTAEPATLTVATPFGELETTVQGHGSQHFEVKGPGRVEVRLASEAGADWTVRDIAPPGVQRVTASRLAILRRGETATGERVAVYAAVAPVLADTIAALLAYPFG